MPKKATRVSFQRVRKLLITCIKSLIGYEIIFSFSVLPDGIKFDLIHGLDQQETSPQWLTAASFPYIFMSLFSVNSTILNKFEYPYSKIINWLVF